jgi:alpha/beta superfamily hydrolase
MPETISFFESENLRLEGMLERVSGTKGVVITHPHPLYGGDMDNPVALAVRDAYRRKGFSTLRFNFRGVGGSGGRHDRGIGERRDVLAARACLAGLGITDIDLAGYSFGAWVNAGANEGFQRMVMVSPPLAFIDFGPPAPIANLSLIVTGSRDEIAPPAMIDRVRARWNPAAAFEVIPGADHFYSGLLETLEDRVAAYI